MLHAYFKEKVENTEILELIEYTLALSKIHIQKITSMFKSQNYSILVEFTEKGIDLKAPHDKLAQKN
ncbi:DUF3231 family protein [Priestia endophytica]|uniref:DUF3231 family protein n=1 Tax=Priestia endophytica TaxID=135735 RepID=UPI000DE582AA